MHWIIYVVITFFALLIVTAFAVAIYAATRPLPNPSTEQIIVSASAMGDYVYSLVRDACVSVYNLVDESKIRIGSGFVLEVDSSQRIVVVTAAHVVLQATELNIVITNVESNNLQLVCDVVGMDKAADVAVIRSQTQGFSAANQKVIQWAEDSDESSQRIGQMVFSIGNPLGQDFHSISSGSLRDPKYVPTTHSGSIESMYMSAPTTSGNSGGPVLVVSGRCIGLSNWVATLDDPPQQLSNFSGGVNAYMASRIVPRLLNNTNNRGYLGLSDIDVVAGVPLLELRNTYPLFVASGFDIPRGVLVLGFDTENLIIPNSRCFNSGMQVGDIIVSISDVNIGVFDNQFSPTRVSWFTNPGTTVNVVTIRPSDGTLHTFQVLLDEFPPGRDEPLTTYC